MSCWRHVRTNLKFAIENIDMSGDKTHILVLVRVEVSLILMI